MGQLKSIAFAQSSSIHEEESGWSGGLGRASHRDIWVRDIRAMVWDCYSRHTLPIVGNVTWSPEGTARRQDLVGLPGYTHGPVHLLWRGEPATKGWTQGK